jgi:S1-C subfamily serine protease
MRAERRGRLALTFAAVLACLAPAPASQAEMRFGAWSMAAKGGRCEGFFPVDTDRAYGFIWAPDGRLGWFVYDATAPKDPPKAIALRVLTAIGETFQGQAEGRDAKDEPRAYALLGNDRRQARMILSGDLVFQHDFHGHPAETVAPLGLLAPRVAACMAEARAQAEAPHPAAPPEEAQEEGPPPNDGPPKLYASGSGVFIDGRGDLITNAHVVRGCRVMRSPNLGQAQVVAVDQASDLALLRLPRAGGPYARLRETGIRLGEPVTAAGYPLQDVLANGLNITRGDVSALAGPGGDRRMLQISAPVQPGNSGGALLDGAGRLIGVVDARLNYDAQQPQNVNFAIAGFVVGAFLRENGVRIDASAGPPVHDIAAAARGFTIYLECLA